MPRTVSSLHKTLLVGLISAVVLLIGACGAVTKPPPDVPTGACGSLGVTGADCAAVTSLALTPALPWAWGNNYGDSTDAAYLGFAVFFDARFSGNENVRCASCHQPERLFADARAVPKALGQVNRNSPTLVGAARLRWQFWDGRADSVWSQALWAFENPAEMNFSRLELAHKLAELHRTEYEATFGKLPDLSDTARFPLKGRPGSPEWAGMTADDQKAINTVVANLGKALEAYMRKLDTLPTKVDAFIAGDLKALTAQEQRGLKVFVSAGCVSCHSGEMFSDEKFHNIGVAAAPGLPADEGREAGLKLLAASEFSSKGAFWDGPPPGDRPGESGGSGPLGAFKTPSLRNLVRTAPYAHNGTFTSLEAVIDFHLKGGGTAGDGFVGTVDPALKKVTLTTEDRDALVALLQALSGPQPGLPWGDWPGH